ncbi:MAG: CHASE4 domain-containing protein, partial [Bacillota bacterium]
MSKIDPKYREMYRLRSLNTRLIAGLFLVALIPLLFFYMLHRLVQEQQLLELERRDMAISGEHAVRLLEGAGRQMLATLEDYAIWNETYDQIDLQEAGWLAENFTDWLPSHFGFRLIALLDRQGQPVYTYGVPPGENPGRWREVHAALAGGRVSG